MNKQVEFLGKALSVSDSSDIIECSIVINSSVTKINTNQVKRQNEQHIENVSNNNSRGHESFNAIRDCIRLSLKKNFQLLPETRSNENQTNFNEKNKFLKIGFNNNDIFNKKENTLQSLNKDINNIPYLSETKLRNVQQWLQGNDFEKVKTPPFANLSIISKSTGKKKIYKRQKKIEKSKSSSSSNSSSSTIDSDVQDVLKAIYGDDWTKKKSFGVKCQTDPKRSNTNFTPLKVTKRQKSSLHSVKCNLLKFNEKNKKSDKENDNSIISGIQSIKLDDSDISLKQFKTLDSGRVDIKERDKLKLIEAVSNRQKTSEIEFHVKKNFRKKLINCESQKKCTTKLVNKTPIKTFLASLSASTPTSRYHPEADEYKKNFKCKKDELIRKLFKLFNNNVFDQKLPDDMNFSWNIKLRGTAGYCYNKRITKSSGEILRVSRIEFSTKIVDRADRLRDTMIHELCHAASWIINGQLDGHGAIWSGWAAKVALRFPELPKIRRCHNYEIWAKYIYKCKNCGYSIKRHSKSINTEKKRCGHCFGILELFINKKKKGESEVPESNMTKTLPTPNKFAIFVRENYRSVKNLKADAKHAEIMKILSEKYALTKITNDIIKN